MNEVAKHDTLDISVRQTSISCAECMVDVEAERVSAESLPTCLDVRAEGTCPRCGELTKWRFRSYPKYTLLLYEGEWHEVEDEPSLLTKLIFWLRTKLKI